jgi:streptomycin 6-kinase
VEVDELTQRLTRRFGAGAARWCAEVPTLAHAIAQRWALTLGDALPGGNSSVAFRCAAPTACRRC